VKIYVVSKSGNSNFALEPEWQIAIVSGYMEGLLDAQVCAGKYAKATDQPAWVYEVEIKSTGSYRISKEVVYTPDLQSKKVTLDSAYQDAADQ